MTKAIALMSGGLDSAISVAIMKDQGIEVIGLFFNNVFNQSYDFRGTPPPPAETAKQLGIEFRLIKFEQAIFDLVLSPKHGYGKNLNPCIDCKIYMLRYAKALMAETGASFLITGEVIGQRPKSQHHDTMVGIAAEAGVDGLVLRPLCARLMEPTIPEKTGLVDRSKLCDIAGRSRHRQYEIAKRFGLTKFGTPAGGCLLTERLYCGRLEDLIKNAELTLKNAQLLRFGRHFRVRKDVKIIAGKNEEQNEFLQALAGADDTLLELDMHMGPIVLVTGPSTKKDIQTACIIAARYSDAPEPSEAVALVTRGDRTEKLPLSGFLGRAADLEALIKAGTTRL